MTALALSASPPPMQFFDDIPDGVVIVEPSGYVRHVNLAFLAMIERPLHEVLGRPLDEVVADEDMMSLIGFQTMFSTVPIQDGNVIFTSSDGRRKPLVISASTSRDGSCLLVTTRTTGMVQRELADASRWVVEEQERSMSLAEARDALAARNDAVNAAQEDLKRAYAKLQDEVATRERLQQQLNLARRLEAIGQLSAGVAHEINTPLQYVGDSVHFLGQACQRVTEYVERVQQLLRAEPPPAWGEAVSALQAARQAVRLDFVMAEMPRAVLAAKEGIEHVSRIVQALKSFAHRGSEEKSESDINSAIENTLVMAQNEYKHVAKVTTQLGDVPPVNCIISEVNQVLLNLIVNAAHAIADAGRPELGNISVSSRLDGEFVEIRISDDGCGIPEAIRHKIFEQFFTTKEVGRGTGQGLALARQIVVEGHGGSVTFETEVGTGTSFVVRLPIDGGAPALT